MSNGLAVAAGVLFMAGVTGLASAAVVGIPTGVAARYADRRSAGAWDRPWWLDAIRSGAMFVVALPFAAMAALTLVWVRLLVVS